MEPTLCLNCGTFPCTCGEQYKKLNDNEYFTLLNNLSKLNKNVDIFVNGKSIVNVLYGLSDTTTHLFDTNDIELMPDDWTTYLTKQDHRNPKELISIIAADKSTETMKFPSGLILAILMRCGLSEHDFAMLFKKWLEQRNGDDVSRFIAPLIDDKATYLKSSIAEIDEALLGFVCATDIEPDAITIMIKNALIAIKTMFIGIREKEIMDSAAMFMKFMYSVIALNEMPQPQKTCKEYIESLINFDIYYMDESFRKFILEYLQEIELPQLTIF